MTGPNNKKKSAATLRRRRASLIRQLPPLKEIMRGSLIERYKRCGRPGCRCTQGKGHGPKTYLSVSMPGTHPEMEYVPLAFCDQVAQLVDNYRKMRRILDEVAEINLELLHRRERFS